MSRNCFWDRTCTSPPPLPSLWLVTVPGVFAKVNSASSLPVWNFLHNVNCFHFRNGIVKCNGEQGRRAKILQVIQLFERNQQNCTDWPFWGCVEFKIPRRRRRRKRLCLKLQCDYINLLTLCNIGKLSWSWILLLLIGACRWEVSGLP